MTQSKKKIILLTTSLILTICLMAFFGVYALTTLKNSTFNVGVKYEPEYLVKVEMGIDGANDGTGNQKIEENEYVEIFNSLNPVSNGMYIDSMSNDTIQINSQTLTPIGVNGDVYFRITSLENETSGNKDLRCVIDCGSATADSGKLVINTPKDLIIATGINATSGTATSSSLGMIKIKLKFSEFVLDFVDLKNLVDNLVYDDNSLNELDFGELGTIKHNNITGKTFYVSDINGLLKLSALVGKVDTTTTEYGSNYGYNNSSGSVVTFEGATIQMLNDIDCENGNNKDNFSKKFIPIGNNYSNSFYGTFDGNNKTITGLYISQTTNNAGLFGYVYHAEIKDLTMQNCKVVSTLRYVGNFVGYVGKKLIISNCSAEETEVSAGDYYVGGIVGYVYGTTTITNCYNTGSVRCSSWYIGGIAGYLKGTTTITNCYNTGSVSGSFRAGGIVGYAENTATITNCYNTGSVSGTPFSSSSSSSDNVGGIVGLVYGTATITNCYNTGSVSGNNEIGGIVGYAENTATITNCYNTGSVSGTPFSSSSFSDNVGGIVGYVRGTETITNCYNTGSVSGDNEIGGIVGRLFTGTETITNCYNTGSVSGTENVGGIVGYVYRGTATITNCYYLKTDDVNASLNGVGVNNGTLTSTSYFGTFSSADSGLTECNDSPLKEEKDFAYGKTDLITVLNAYVDDIQTYNGIDLKSWVDGSDGYPVFAL